MDLAYGVEAQVEKDVPIDTSAPHVQCLGGLRRIILRGIVEHAATTAKITSDLGAGEPHLTFSREAFVQEDASPDVGVIRAQCFPPVRPTGLGRILERAGTAVEITTDLGAYQPHNSFCGEAVPE